MLFLTQLDYDRARIYIEKETCELLNQWKNLTKLSQVAQHFLVQRIQRIQEMSEFLSLIKDADRQSESSKRRHINRVISSMLAWRQRLPSQSFDPLNIWDDVSCARLFFIDQYCLKFSEDQLQEALTKRNMSGADGASESAASLREIQVMLHVQTAKGALKMGMYDSSDRYLKMAQYRRNVAKKNASQSEHARVDDEMRLIVPIIKLKTEQCKQELRNYT